jgi:hypothetical protein
LDFLKKGNDKMQKKQQLLDDYILMIHGQIKELQKLSVHDVDANVLRALQDAVKAIRSNEI